MSPGLNATKFEKPWDRAQAVNFWNTRKQKAGDWSWHQVVLCPILYGYTTIYMYNSFFLIHSRLSDLLFSANYLSNKYHRKFCHGSWC